MSLANFKASNHPQQTAKRGANDAVDDRGTDPASTSASEVERCPGCGSIVDSKRNTCRPVGVDVTQVGYRYLAGTWGYCLHLGRDVRLSDPPWLAAREAAAATRGRAEALREAAEVLPALTEGTDRIATETWRPNDRDIYSLAIEEAQAALLARADSLDPAPRGDGQSPPDC